MRAALAVGLVAAMSGCWAQTGGNAGNTRFNDVENTLNPDTVGSLTEKWNRTNRFETFSEPMIQQGVVYTTRHDEGLGETTVDALRLSDGEVAWRHDLEATSAGPAVIIDDAVWVSYKTADTPYCVSNQRRLDLKTGAVLSTEETIEAMSPPVAGAGVVAVTERYGCRDYRNLVVRNLATGAMWEHHFDGVTLTASTPTIAGDRIYVVAGDDLHAFDVTGNKLWTVDSAPGRFEGRPVAGPGGQVLVEHVAGSPVMESTVQAYGSTGGLSWQSEVQTPGASTFVSGMAVGYDRVFVSYDDQVAVYRATGCGLVSCAPLWTFSAAVRGAPTLGGTVVYVAEGQDVIALPAAGCGAATCSELTRLTLPSVGNPPSEYSLGDGRLVGAGPGAHLFALGL